MATGFFGKLPAAGDFVARGLPPGSRGALDRWLTVALGAAAGRPEAWPENGFLGVVVAGPGPVLLAILPSRDAAGRAFPLAAVSPARGAGAAEAEEWGSAVRVPLAAACGGGCAADALAGALAPLAPEGGLTPLAPPCLWAPGGAPEAPEEVLRRRFPISSD